MFYLVGVRWRSCVAEKRKRLAFQFLDNICIDIDNLRNADVDLLKTKFNSDCNELDFTIGNLNIFWSNQYASYFNKGKRNHLMS